MGINRSSLKEFYYTNDHEWIDFQGAVAYIGISEFKLIGLDEIQQLEFHDATIIKKCGDIIASIQFNDQRLDVQMPVDGKILDLNESLLNGNKQILLQQPETNGWIALIIPDHTENKKNLVLPYEFHLQKLIDKILLTNTYDEVRCYCDAAIEILKRHQVYNHVTEQFIANIIKRLEKLNPLNKNPQQWTNITSARVYFNRKKIY